MTFTSYLGCKSNISKVVINRVFMYSHLIVFSSNWSFKMAWNLEEVIKSLRFFFWHYKTPRIIFIRSIQWYDQYNHMINVMIWLLQYYQYNNIINAIISSIQYIQIFKRQQIFLKNYIDADSLKGNLCGKLQKPSLKGADINPKMVNSCSSYSNEIWQTFFHDYYT